jgi:transposase
VKTKVSLTNRLQAELDAFWPGAARVFCRLDSPIALAFLERYPSPKDAQSLGEKRLSSFLSRHSYCGGKSAAQLLAKLRSAPRGLAKETEEEAAARRAAVLSLLAALRPVVEQIGLLELRIADAVRAHPDGEIFLSLFRHPDSTLTAATLLCEIGDRRERYPSAEALAADAGMCPVAKESGRRKVATFRRACDKRLRDAMTTLADSSRLHNPWAKDVYLRARGRGCDQVRTPSGCWAGRGCG